MKAIRATDDLIVEAWPGWGAAGDRSLVKVRSLALEQDGEAAPGTVVVFDDEIEHLVEALAEAREALAQAAGGDRAVATDGHRDAHIVTTRGEQGR